AAAQQQVDDLGRALDLRRVARGLEVAGHALGPELAHGLLDQPDDAFGRAGVGPVVIGAAVVVAAARLEEGAVDAGRVGAAGHDALNAVVEQLHERHRVHVAVRRRLGVLDDGGTFGGVGGHDVSPAGPLVL